MVWHPTKDAVLRLWGRRWVRRISYLVVAGATAYVGVPWLASRPAVLHYAVGQLDKLVQEETGLPLAIGRVEFHPLLGSLVLQDVRLGADLLSVDRIEVQADFWSLVGPSKHLRALRIEHPHLRLTEGGLQSLHLKERPPRQGPLPQVRLDLFSLVRGEVELPEALHGMPALRYRFDAKATGVGPNHLRVNLAGPQLEVRGPEGWEKGRLDLAGEFSEQAWKVQEAYLRLAETQVRLSAKGRAATPKGEFPMEGTLSGILNAAQATRWAGLSQPPLRGSLEFQGALQGSLQHPQWNLSVEGQELRPGFGFSQPGKLNLKAGGGLDRIRLEALRWASSQGDLEVEGAWAAREPIHATVRGSNLDLEALGQWLRLPEFKAVRAQVEAEVRSPEAGQPLDRLDRWGATLKTRLIQHSVEAGGLEASLDAGQAKLSSLRLALEAIQLEGSGTATLGAHGLSRAEAEGKVEVDAGQVAQALAAWKVVDLDMEGQAKGAAHLRWDREEGLGLEGTLEVLQPRWQAAQADSLRGEVSIHASELRVQNIDLRKDQGRGGGELWLTWAKLAPGEPQIDMCYFASGLPIAEGLRAARLRDAEGRELPITGLGSGWVRLWGPYQHLAMQGNAQAESAETYGIKIPAASSDFQMDLDTLQLRLQGVRIAERPDLLGRGDAPPEGALGLVGQADMDFRAWSWWVDLRGRVDTQVLALPGPRIQALAEARLLGPITSPFGALDLPQGRITLSQGRLFLGDRSIEGLQGQVRLEKGRLGARLGLQAMERPIVDLQVHQAGTDLVGSLDLALLPDTAKVDAQAQSLTQDVLEDFSLSAKLQGRWVNGRDLTWTGTLDQFSARFNAFELHQNKTSTLQGNAQGALVDIPLVGGSRQPAEQGVDRAARLHITGALPFSNAAPMALRARGAADLAHLKAILDQVMEVDEYNMLSDLHIQGTGRFDILSHGTYTEPLLDGTLSLEKGQMVLRRYQGVENLQAEIILKDRTLSISEQNPLRGSLAQGELRLSGTMAWQLGGLDAYKFKASLANFQLRNLPEGLDLQGSLQADLEGREDGGTLRGKLSADRLNYNAEIKLSDLILRSAVSDTGLGGLDLDDPLDRIRLELDMDLRSPWSFDTNLLKLEGRTEGPFLVRGTLAHPVPKGVMVFTPGGRITNIFPAGDVVVNRGSLTFSESRPLDPMISLQGSLSSIPGYAVNLDVHGTLSNLSILPSSTPVLRQDEIVAILINPSNVANVGTAAASSSATQGAISQGLGGATGGLLTTLAFAPFQEQLRKVLGVDRVGVTVRTGVLGGTEREFTIGKTFYLFGQGFTGIYTHKQSSELNIDSGQFEWRLGNLIFQFGGTKAGSAGAGLSGEIRHTWSPK